MFSTLFFLPENVTSVKKYKQKCVSISGKINQILNKNWRNAPKGICYLFAARLNFLFRLTQRRIYCGCSYAIINAKLFITVIRDTLGGQLYISVVKFLISMPFIKVKFRKNDVCRKFYDSALPIKANPLRKCAGISFTTLSFNKSENDKSDENSFTKYRIIISKER